MALTGLRRSYFIVFTGVSLTVELIAFDEVFWAAVGSESRTFLLQLHIPRTAVFTNCKANGMRTNNLPLPWCSDGQSC